MPSEEFFPRNYLRCFFDDCVGEITVKLKIFYLLVILGGAPSIAAARTIYWDAVYSCVDFDDCSSDHLFYLYLIHLFFGILLLTHQKSFLYKWAHNHPGYAIVLWFALAPILPIILVLMN